MLHVRRLAGALLAAAMLFLPCIARAADAYPSKPVTIVVPYPAGGVVDVIGRLVAERLAASLGQPFVVENRVGAGGTIGATQVANAAPDGYTLLMGGAGTHAFAKSMYKSLPYDPAKSFRPIVRISDEPMVLVVNPTLPVSSYADLEKYLKAKGDSVNYASNGPGTFPQLAPELLKHVQGLKTMHVPYAGGPQALVALLTNEVTFSINHMPVVLSQIKAGKLKPLAVTGKRRSPLLTDVPTFDELGIPVEANAWWGLFAPAGAPNAVIDKLNATMNEILKTPEMRERLLKIGDEPAGGSPRDLADYVQAEIDKWSPIIKAAGVKVN